MVKIRKNHSEISQQDKKRIINELPEEISVKEKPTETLIELNDKVSEYSDKKEGLPVEEIKELREKIEKMDLDDSLNQQLKKRAQDIKSLQDKEKIKYLLEIAKGKGVVFAVKVAQKMDNPYVLDTLHDILAEKGYYKKFIK